MSDYVGNGDWCYYCRTYYSAEYLTTVVMTNEENKAVCDDCLRGLENAKIYSYDWEGKNE